jgi:hypothetical protein
MFNYAVFVILCLGSFSASAQSGIVRGKVYNKINNDPIPFASIVLQGTTTGVAADENGKFELTGVSPGQYNVEATFVGFRPLVLFEVQVTSARPVVLEFALEEEAKRLNEIVVSAGNLFAKSDESPLSFRSIGTTEIKRTPGGNRDVSRVIRSFPGVASPPGFRNDIVIRGGAPIENTFYLDGIQIPVINHFQTQGSSGGPVGIINVDLLKEVNFYSGAFPANRGNTLSSVFDFQVKEGRSDRWTFNGIVGATDVGITLEGPVTGKSSLIFSVRRSYLKFLFDALNLPFLPVYNDTQFKYKYKFNNRNQLTVLGIGAIDEFELNFDAPQKAGTEDEKREAEYILNILPVSTQWNYTTGLKYDHFRNNANTTVVISTNTLNNASVKYQGNDDSRRENLIQDYNSRETETRLRVEDFSTSAGGYTLTLGANFERAKYDTRDFSRIIVGTQPVIRDFESVLTLSRWGLFGQISRRYLDRLTLSFGVRGDATDYSREMRNLLEQLSPRLSASYSLSPSVNANFNTGIYFQLPAYTVLGFRNSLTGRFENRDNGVRYIRSRHVVSGLEFNLERNARITAEGFYKWYDRYPFLLEESISLANLGADFGVVGNAPVISSSDGRSYGLELLLQQKLYKGTYGLFSYTWVRSEFRTITGKFAPSSWDNRHLASLTGGKRFSKNWEMGLRWLFSGGAPYTPFLLQETLRRTNWDIRPFGIPDYSRLNTERTSAYHQLDIRLDKKYFFRKWSLDVYLDVQNVYNYVTRFQDNIDIQRDDQGTPIVNPDNDAFYLPRLIQNTTGTVLPTIGIIVEL